MTHNQEYAEAIENCLDKLAELIDDSGISNQLIEYNLAALRDVLSHDLKELKR